jgi:hypothetical protein
MLDPTTPATALTLGQAARLTGLGKTSLARAIRAGRLSATRDDSGRYTIDGAELARVFPLRAPGEATGATGDATGTVARQATPDATGAALTAEVSALREMLAMMREQNAELKLDRDGWRDQAQRLALAPPKPVPEPPARWSWRWLRSTG